MKNKKDSRIGETRMNKQGLAMKIVRYVNNKNVTIEFIETGEQRKTTYYNFQKGSPVANLIKYPPHICSYNHAKWIFLGGFVLVLGIMATIIYSIIR